MSQGYNPNRDSGGRFAAGSTSESAIGSFGSDSVDQRLAGAHEKPDDYLDDPSATIRAIARTSRGIAHDPQSFKIVSSLGLGALAQT